jgi:CheY-like chemotaxis protein
MDGIALLQQLADAGLPDIRRVAVLSAFDTPVLRERALRHGAHVLVAKPLLPQTLRRLLDLQRPLPIAPQTRSEAPGTPADACDRTTLIGEFDALLGEADSEAVTLWEQHGSAVLDMLPAAQAKALAGAMQRFDFDAAQAALRRGRTP